MMPEISGAQTIARRKNRKSPIEILTDCYCRLTGKGLYSRPAPALINSKGEACRERTIPMDVNIDSSVILTLRDDVGDTALERLVGIFIEECVRNCAEIAQFLSEDDLSGAEIVAHRFKSTARQFGALGPAEVCMHMERACAEGHGQRASDLLKTLTEKIPQIRDNMATTLASALASPPKDG